MSEGLVLSGRYRLLSRLGAGGMGSVWRARDLTLDADVAIKLMGAEFVGSGEAVARFRREARAAAAIRSGHVVQILDYGVDGDTPFIAMELLRGDSLADRLARMGPLSAPAAAHLLGHVARALTLAHEHGIVHRDLKPDNIFIVREGDEDVAKVLDFGVARRREGLGDSSGLQTRAGAILGTPFYMSPEQSGGEPVDELSDIWAFGVIACECLTGTRPFAGDTLGALFRAVCIADIPRPSSLGAVPEGFDEWFARAAARDKSQRYKTVRQAAEDLKAVCARAVVPQAVRQATPAERQFPSLSAGHPATQLSPGAGDVARSEHFEQTAPASAHSIAASGSAKKKRTLLVPALIAGPVLVAGALYLGLKEKSSPVEPDGSASSSASRADEAPSPGREANSAAETQAIPAPAASAAPASASGSAPQSEVVPLVQPAKPTVRAPAASNRAPVRAPQKSASVEKAHAPSPAPAAAAPAAPAQAKPATASGSKIPRSLIDERQ
ncbi:MAG TPA: serine/threonine-protein kinase [Polyangiaceae bacterium]|nr:serine/threonine-protein kinase [Polyangiaceae bacterium]